MSRVAPITYVDDVNHELINIPTLEVPTGGVPLRSHGRRPRGLAPPLNVSNFLSVIRHHRPNWMVPITRVLAYNGINSSTPLSEINLATLQTPPSPEKSPIFKKSTRSFSPRPETD